MSASAVIIDAGPIVALLDARDRYHEWAVSVVKQVAPPLRTCEAALSEAFFLAGKLADGRARMLELLQRPFVGVDFNFESERRHVIDLLARYRNVPMSLADACLVRMSELSPEAHVLTLDADFKVYRRQGRKVIPLIFPE